MPFSNGKQKADCRVEFLSRIERNRRIARCEYQGECALWDVSVQLLRCAAK